MNFIILYYISLYDILFLIPIPHKLILKYMALNQTLRFLHLKYERLGLLLCISSWFSVAYRKFGEDISIYLYTFLITYYLFSFRLQGEFWETLPQNWQRIAHIGLKYFQNFENLAHVMCQNYIAKVYVLDFRYF